MRKGRRSDQEYKNIIVDLYKSEMSLAELSSEYDIAKSTINGLIKYIKEIKLDENQVMSLKEIKELKKEWQELKSKMKYKKDSRRLKNVLKKDYTTTSINKKWVGDITYVHTIKDG